MTDKEKGYWRCQFCEEYSKPSLWKHDACPKCGYKYDYQLAQDGDDE